MGNSIIINLKRKIMALASWVTASPKSGTEDGTVLFTASTNTNRDGRTTQAIIKCVTNPSVTRTVTITQPGKEVFTMDSSKPDAPAVGSSVTVAGTCNAAKLTFVLKMKGVSVPQNTNMFGARWEMIINGGSANSGAAIPGDPGATGVYNFSAKVTYTENPALVKVPFEFEVTTPKGTKKTCAWGWLPGTSKLSTDKDTIDMSSNSGSVNITSNDKWTLE